MAHINWFRSEAHRGDIQQQQRFFIIRKGTAIKKAAKKEMMAAVSPMSVMKCHNSNASTNATIQDHQQSCNTVNIVHHSQNTWYGGFLLTYPSVISCNVASSSSITMWCNNFHSHVVKKRKHIVFVVMPAAPGWVGSGRTGRVGSGRVGSGCDAGVAMPLWRWC